jgi:hypothetical protein
LFGIDFDIPELHFRDGDTYRGKWHYNETQKRWEGNPALSAEVQDVITAIKHKCGAEGGDRTHSLAMSKEHMDKMFAWSEAQCSNESCKRPPRDLETRAFMTKHLEFKAFASTAWTIWSRYTSCSIGDASLLTEMISGTLSLSSCNESMSSLAWKNVWHILQNISVSIWSTERGGNGK